MSRPDLVSGVGSGAIPSIPVEKVGLNKQVQTGIPAGRSYTRRLYAQPHEAHTLCVLSTQCRVTQAPPYASRSAAAKPRKMPFLGPCIGLGYSLSGTGIHAPAFRRRAPIGRGRHVQEAGWSPVTW